MRPTTVSASDKRSRLQLTQLFLWESKPFDSAVARYSDHNSLSQRKRTCRLCMCVSTESRLNNRQVKFLIKGLLKHNFPPFNVLLNLCALAVIDDACRAQCGIEMPAGATVLAEDGAGVTYGGVGG